MQDNSHHRPVRSFVRREGRLTKGQAKAIENQWRCYGIDFSKEPLDLAAIFGRSSPKIIDIGAGAGETTLFLAQRHPENDYLAIEVHKPGIGNLLRNAAVKEIRNVRVIHHDVVDVLRYQIQDTCLDEAYLFFSDPWPKKRHHKRRLISKSFVQLLATKLKAHARTFIATDWDDMARHILEVCDSEPGLVNLAGHGHDAPRPYWRPVTRFEARGLQLNHRIRDFVYARTG